MISDLAERKNSITTPSKDQKPICGCVLVRVDKKERLTSVIPNAVAVALGLGLRIKLVEIVNPSLVSDSLIDPVEWDIQKREIQLHLEHLAALYSHAEVPIDFQVLEHVLPADIGDCGGDVPPILAFGRHGSELPWHMDEANRILLENQCSSILMVPYESEPRLNVTYSRIVVPLDGSSRAEAVLPNAIAIARKHGAQLYLVHITPSEPLTHNGPLSVEDRDLENQVAARNDRVAREYLKMLRTRCGCSDVRVNTQVMNEGDAKRQLLDSATSLEADLIILNSHGSGGHSDVFSGSVATFALEHAMIPVLMIGQRSAKLQAQLFSGLDASGTRQPGSLLSDT